MSLVWLRSMIPPRPWDPFSQTYFETRLLSKREEFENDCMVSWTSGSRNHTYQRSCWLSCETPSLILPQRHPPQRKMNPRNRWRPKIYLSSCHPRTVIRLFHSTNCRRVTSCLISFRTEASRCDQSRYDHCSLQEVQQMKSWSMLSKTFCKTLHRSMMCSRQTTKAWCQTLTTLVSFPTMTRMVSR